MSDDLLNLLMESNMEQFMGEGEGEGESGMSSGRGMSVDDIIGECKLFYFASVQTTSVLLTWTMVVLSPCTRSGRTVLGRRCSTSSAAPAQCRTTTASAD
jgi:hypothetical protein